MMTLLNQHRKFSLHASWPKKIDKFLSHLFDCIPEFNGIVFLLVTIFNFLDGDVMACQNFPIFDSIDLSIDVNKRIFLMKIIKIVT